MGHKMRKTCTAVFIIVSAVAQLHASSLYGAVRASVGEVTVARGAQVPAAYEQTDWKQYEKAERAHDDIGLKQLFSAGRFIRLQQQSQLLVLDFDLSSIENINADIKQIIDAKASVWHSCMQQNIRLSRAGLPERECIRPDPEGGDEFAMLSPTRTAEQYVDEFVSVNVRILTGIGQGGSVWTKLKYLKLPTQPRTTKGK